VSVTNMATKKKRTERVKTVNYMPHFPFTVKIVFTRDYAYSRRTWLGITAEDNSAGCTSHWDSGNVLIILPVDAPIQHVAHECCHAIFRMMDYLSLHLSRSDMDANETYCYLCGNLVVIAVEFQKRAKSG